MVKTTRDDSSVNKHAYLVAQRIAECLLIAILILFAIGPFEHTGIFQIDILGNAPTIMALVPRTRETFCYKFVQKVVLGIISTLVPQTEHNNDTGIS